MERDLTKNLAILDNAISTHTLTWSVTGIRQKILVTGLTISTHTLTWSVTFHTFTYVHC